MDNRPSWDKYFLNIAELTSERSNCIKRKVGCIIVKDKRILSLGYNGTPSGMKNCFDGGCDRCLSNVKSGDDLDKCLCLHAEDNALLFVSKQDLLDSIMYVTLIPCLTCVKKIIQCNIKRVIFKEFYREELDRISINIMINNNIIVEQFV